VADVVVAGDVSRWYQVGDAHVHAVRGVSLRVADAEMVAVLGRSGAGKTTLLHICGGLDQPDRGRVAVAGRAVDRLEGDSREQFLQRSVGWMFQRPRLLPLLTAEENVAIVLRIAGDGEAEAARSARVALEAVGLEGRGSHLSGELSAGEQRRVALARALVKAPALLIADEPTAQLDAGTTRDILALLRAAADSGTAVLLASQNQTVAEFADRVLVMDDGALSEMAARW
jgi:ABC-type lipoprotein export system ATPase subunit